MNKLAEYRIDKHFTQSGLARKTGLSRQTIIMLEKGERRPTADTSKKIADVLGMTIEQIFFDEDVPQGVREAAR